MKTLIPSIKGTRDFYPEDMARRNWLYEKIRQVSLAYGYQEYDGPFLEKIDLYAAKSGEELVKEQAFVFPDRGGDLITLRPELTPSLARMVSQRQGRLVFPLRWWSFGPFWRYERPQKGRTREFFQWNIDLIGPNSPEADAELVAIAAGFFEATGLTPDRVAIRVNNRKLMETQIQSLGIQVAKRQDVFHLIDRRDKMDPQAWEAYARERGLENSQVRGILNLLADSNLWQQSAEMQRFFAALDALGASSYVHFDPAVIRGLDYYTATVFEAYERAAGGRAILGGGRYDNLVSDVGGAPVSAVGFAMGDVMISIVLAELGLLQEGIGSGARVLVTVFDETRLAAAYLLASDLRRAGVNTACYPEAVRLEKQLKYADRMGMRWVLISGPDEEARGLVTVKDLKEHTQIQLGYSDLAQVFRGMLALERAV
ncbi:MAG: histidine--tRNA ligase [Chloroflexi bacterium]|nr:histidine--tRNA ligase [Chloroflexota bacterium]